MRLALLAGWLLISVVGEGCVANPEFHGPMPVRNQHPAQLTVMHMDPASTQVLSAGQTSWRADAAYTSLFLFGNDLQGAAWFMDGELLRTAATANIGLGKQLQLGIQVAGAHTTGGFLDSFIVDYHDAFGLPDQDRSDFPDDEYRVEATRGATTVWSVQESSAELLDLPIQLTWQILEPKQRQLGLAVRGGVELPLGDQDTGYGNGQLDVSLGAVVDYQAYGIRWNGHVQHTFAGTPRPARQNDLEFQDVTSIGLASELPLYDDLHALVQVEWETSTLRQLGPAVTDREQVSLWVGGRYQVAPEWSLEVGFGEDLRGLASPDFTAWLSATWKPGG